MTEKLLNNAHLEDFTTNNKNQIKNDCNVIENRICRLIKFNQTGKF